MSRANAVASYAYPSCAVGVDRQVLTVASTCSIPVCVAGGVRTGCIVPLTAHRAHRANRAHQRGKGDPATAT